VPNLSKISSEFSFSKNIKIQIHKYTNTQIHKYNKYFQSKKNIIDLCFSFTSYLENATLFFYAVCGNSRGATGFRFAAVIEVV